jgi:hypothetical protein
VASESPRRIEGSWQRAIDEIVIGHPELRLAINDPVKLRGMRALYIAGALEVYRLIVETSSIVEMEQVVADLADEFASIAADHRN